MFCINEKKYHLEIPFGTIEKLEILKEKEGKCLKTKTGKKLKQKKNKLNINSENWIADCPKLSLNIQLEITKISYWCDKW